jgi:hypothetical protein
MANAVRAHAAQWLDKLIDRKSELHYGIVVPGTVLLRNPSWAVRSIIACADFAQS